MQTVFRKKINDPCSTNHQGRETEVVITYKFLGITFDNQLKWTENAIAFKKITAQRLLPQKTETLQGRNKPDLNYSLGAVYHHILYGLHNWKLE